MIVAEWKMKGVFKGDATKVAQEIQSIGEEASPEEILEKARNEQTELHKCFEWNDGIAAEKWRLHTARQIVCQLVIPDRSEDNNEHVPIRVFYKTEDSKGYKPLEVIIANKDSYQSMLRQAKAELNAFKMKYKTLAELDEIFALIDLL